MTFTASDWSEARAAGILADHARGLHDGYDRDNACTWPGCDDAYWRHAQAQENEENPWALW